ncbi:MAG TPA: S8 family serine peptidase [Gaiellaceae bacterium]|nr:S8 family serine peptidase [Gaiellaceae bacterium]
MHTKVDAAKTKLAPSLQQKLASGSTASVAVFVTLKQGDPAAVKQLLTSDHTASYDGLSLVIGRVGAQQLAKLASVKGVSGVQPIAFKQTGQPTGTDPEVGNQPDKKTRNEALREFQKNSVPYAKAPPLKKSNFDTLRKLDALDAKTHNFTGAWDAGYTGAGVQAAVLDGGTDFGHPDLIGTWQTWGSEASDPGWIGWPKAFDPYDTLVLLEAPDLISQNLTWYDETTAATPTCHGGKKGKCSVSFATRTGPSRNISAPSGTNTHTYTFPASWSKSGTVRLASHPDDYLLELYGERPAVLVTDPHTAGVYDTVYVDLNDDYDFGDEKPVTKQSPASYRDLNGDGYTDLSGGLLYFISDGNTRIPGGPTSFGFNDKPGAGEFLAWTGDFDPAIEGHGTLTASNVVGQGVINGKAPKFQDLRGPGTKGHKLPGMVLGGAPDAKLTPFGDVYFSFDFSTQFGYFLTGRYGVQVTSNSYGTSTSDNDGMDAASQEADVITDTFGDRTTPVFSTGNGAPGFGTVTAPSPVHGIQVGAATQFGGTGWDSIKNLSQVTDNEVIEWSNRGPGANGRNGTDVVADGSYSDGDSTLNTIINGRNAWVTWGGTSRSTPVTVGAIADIQQAYKQAHGTFADEETIKSLLKSSAKDLGNESYVQGAGSVDAGKAVQAALGNRATVSPNEWRPATDPEAASATFPQTMAPGDSATQTFDVSGPGNWTTSDRVLRKVATDQFSFTSQPVAQESVSNFNAPDYLMNITDKIKAHPDADLVMIRANYPRSEFDGDANYRTDQSWRLLAYNWTDLNHDGRLWTDANGNGVVNHADKNHSSNIDGFNDIDFGKSEMEQGEYERFFYHRPGANTLLGFVGEPNQRMADGIFLGFQHSAKNPNIDQTHFTVQITYYKNVDWSWVTETQPAGGHFSATINVPADTPYGMYDGAVVASNGSDKMVVPVAVTVAATAQQDSDGNLTGALTFGNASLADQSVANSQSDSLYNNGSFFGANDWTWRQESGDWRFYYLNVPQSPPDGTLFLTDTKWDDAAPYTDLDTLIFGPTEAGCQLLCDSVDSLDTIGGSENAYIGSGTWLFDTATGGAEDIAAAPASQGMHAIVEHGVSFDGDKFDVPFTTTVGSASVNPSSVEQSTADGTGAFDVTFKSNLDLTGLSADAFGLSQPQEINGQASQDDPNDPSSASVKENLTLHHASKATFTLDVGPNDLDLFVLYDANHDGHFTSDELIASSTAGAGTNEEIDLLAPPDGDYQIWIHGFQVTPPGNFTLGEDIVQGNDLTISGIPSGAIPANTPVTLHVTYNKADMVSGQSYNGQLLLGPSTAPTAISIPVTINRS